MSRRWFFPLSVLALIAIGIVACNINPQPLPPGDDSDPTPTSGGTKDPQGDDDNGEAIDKGAGDDDSTDSPSAGAFDAGADGATRDGGDGGK
jgi:hypothetical protein